MQSIGSDVQGTARKPEMIPKKTDQILNSIKIEYADIRVVVPYIILKISVKSLR